MMKKLFLMLGFCLLLWCCQNEQGTVIRMETSLGNIRFRLYDDTPLHRENMLKLVREGFYEGILFHRVIQNFMIQTGDPTSKGATPGVDLGEGDVGYTIKAELLPHYFHRKGVVAAAREGNHVNPERNSSGSHFYIVQGKSYTSEALDRYVEKVNNHRYADLLQQLEAKRAVEILQIGNDKEKLKRIRQELADEAKTLFEKRKLILTDEQKNAYTTLGGTPHLDGEYTVFGEVIEGLEVVEKIAATPTNAQDRPKQDVVILKMVIE